MFNEYKLFLDTMTEKERSIFFYCFVLKVPQTETARRLHYSKGFVGSVYKALKVEKENLKLIDMIIEAYCKDDDML